jgi:hypothetical protein
LVEKLVESRKYKGPGEWTDAFEEAVEAIDKCLRRLPAIAKKSLKIP